MTLRRAKNIVKKLSENGIEVELREDYSGRGMYGRTTAGVILENAWSLSEAEKICRGLKSVNRDGMGMGLILD